MTKLDEIILPSLCALLLAAACSSSSSQERGDASAGQDPERSDAATPVVLDSPIDQFGYSVVGEDIYPPLYQRVEAKCVAVGPSDACAADEDCGPGFACVCGLQQGRALHNQCVPAECRTSAECNGGQCLLSIGSDPGDCCSFGHLALVCTRSASTCRHGGDCVGNGIACIYDAQLDYFACKPSDCFCN